MVGVVLSAPPLVPAVATRPLRPRVVVALAAAVLLLALTVQDWSPRRAVHPAAPASSSAPAPAIDADTAGDLATHTVTPVPGRPGTFEVRAPGYRAGFDASGVTYAPSGADGPLGISLTALERGHRVLDLEVGAWSGRGTVASRPVSPGVDEQVTARTGEIEWDVVLSAPPSGTGDLVVRAGLSGLAGEAAQVQGPDGPAWRLPLGGGATTLLGETVVLDAAGHELHRALPVMAGGALEVVVPEEVLADATYPVTVDPTVGDPTTVDGSFYNEGPSAAFDGQDYLVVWVDFGGVGDILAARVSGDGTTVAGVFTVSESDSADTSPDVAWNGTSFLVVWDRFQTGTGRDIYSQVVNEAGFEVGLDVPISDVAGHQRAPAVAAAGSTFYVVWGDERNGAADVFGGRVSGIGLPLDGDGRAVTSDAKGESLPDVAWNGTNFLVVYELVFDATDEDVRAQLVNASGAPVGSSQALSILFAHEQDPAVASSGSGFLVVWEDTRNGGRDIYSTRTDANGVRIGTTGIPTSTSSGEQRDPAVAFDGAYLVAWRDERIVNDPDIRATRVTTGGTVQDPDGFLVDPATTVEKTPAVAPARGSERWVVPYISDEKVLQRLVSSK